MQNPNPHVEPGQIVNTKYCGPKERLQGKGCLCRQTSDREFIEARFFDADTMMTTGWHPLPRSDFEYWSPRV